MITKILISKMNRVSIEINLQRKKQKRIYFNWFLFENDLRKDEEDLNELSQSQKLLK